MSIIRPARIQDLEQIVTIYNCAVAAGFETAETEAVSVVQKQGWFAGHHSDAYPIFVCENEGTITGWSSISPYREGRQALRCTVEVSYYVHPACKGRGFGSRLLSTCLDYCREKGYKTIFAIVIDGNDASLALLRKYGFSEWGRLPGAYEYRGEQRDHLYYGVKPG